MLAWLTDNIGNILVGAGLVLAVVSILWKMRKDKKAGKTSCGCDCSQCGGNCSDKKS